MDVETNKDTSIKSWWKKVTHNANTTKPTQKQEESLRCARAAIAYVDNDIQYVGFIPVIVAKCGSFLKDQGLYTEGVFRMSGSAKRIGQLQQLFNTSPDYGRQLDWKGYSVHDAASVLRRFLNYLPEPVIVHELYQPFRDVVSSDTTTELEKVAQFQGLIEQLPEHHQYLLFYLLDLLSLFSQSMQITKMDSFNLASVFTPGILLNPEHAMIPAQYKSSQKVVQFLIEHQHCFKMPRSSWFTVLKEQVETKTDLVVPTTSTSTPPSTTTPTLTSPPPPPPPHRHNSQPTHYHTFHTHHPISNPSNTKSHATVNLSEVFNSSTKDQRIKRAKTMPSRRSRYGPNDPLQIVQLNKSVIEAGQNKV
ncbi:Rho-GTPase-activating protein 5 [Choanephora cucurbitarum]|uniref:Rho-GTPase-activating protein 5 n=1 Tax=Choanephora cucurbitarum TaxID=101091 RepID=A0A1C7NJ11_9FUNG|nr:Rho-GTPase-activating protein 5 [Choanephora cucurbitarum]